MSYQGINTGTTPNDGTGDSLLVGADKINDNFGELYNLIGDGTDLPVGIVTEITAGSNISISTSYGSVEVSIDEITNIDITATSLVVSGITTLGIVTGATYYGDGSNLTGLGETANVRTDTLVVTGVSTLGVVTGVTAIEATTYYGDGSNLTGVADALQSRTTVSGSTTSIINNGIGNTDITGFKSYALMKVGLSTAGWLRIYTDSASRSADASRSVGEDPAAGSGVIAEVVTTGISTQQNISPFTIGGNMDDPVDTTIYVAITNQSGTTQSIAANLTILKLEE